MTTIPTHLRTVPEPAPRRSADRQLPSTPSRPSGNQLLRIARLLGEDPALTDQLVLAPDATTRQWVEVDSSPALQIWLIAWPSGTSTGWHDHGGSAGAFLVLRGSLQERTWAGSVRSRGLAAGDGRPFGAGHAHDVLNPDASPALSLHLYAPRLDRMTRYVLADGGLRVTGTEREGAGW